MRHVRRSLDGLKSRKGCLGLQERVGVSVKFSRKFRGLVGVKSEGRADGCLFVIKIL